MPRLVFSSGIVQSIYPLLVFILVALDKIHYSRGPQSLCNGEIPERRGCSEAAVPVTFEIRVDAERNGTDSAHQMVDGLQRTDSISSVEETHKVELCKVSG